MPYQDDNMTETAYAVGDINSSAKGSAARANAGKLPLDLMPISHLCFPHSFANSFYTFWLDIEAFELRNITATKLAENYMLACAAWLSWNPADVIEKVTRVLERGAIKYAAWNWAKGQNWSVCIGSMKRHLWAYSVRGEELDSESGLHHLAHVGANILFLSFFETYYRQGDDRIPATALER